MADRVFKEVGGWAVGADEVQWILYRRRNTKLNIGWVPLSFVSSDRDILARCMRDKGVEADTAVQLLEGLPDTFREWKTLRRAP